MVPKFEDFLYPFLQILQKGQISTSDMKKKLVDYFKLTDEDIAATTKSGAVTQLSDRMGWCRQYFRRAGFLEIPKRGTWKITQRGKDFLKKHNSLTIDDLMDYKEFAEYAGNSRKHKNDEQQSSVSLSITPTDALDAAFAQIKNSLIEDLLDKVKNMSPYKFEDLVVSLLVAMGYSGDFKDAAIVTQPSNDKGVDGIIKEDKLGLDKICIQAKRWTSSVGSPIVQQFAGALDGFKANKGGIITTSDFTKGARDVAEKSTKKIILINGRELASYMIEYNLGVSVVKPYIVKKVDEGYFDESE